jgi:predicted flap endonuclease-1-like 5' DNA nuclease
MAADDLTRIRGIDESLEAKLRQLKVDRYADIAAWRAADVRRVGEALGLEGRIERENWIEQAQILAAGGETAFASRLRRGELASAEPTPDEGEPPAVAPIGQDGGKGEPAVVESVKSDDVGRSASPPAEADVVRRSDVTGLRSVRSEALRGADGAPAAQMRPVRGPGLDDLKRIRGIGVMIERKLNGLGVASYEQIANWTMADIERVSRVLDFKGRIERENWVEQARILASGGQTEFARRVERGEIETSRSRSS